jgi:hypothetical protein
VLNQLNRSGLQGFLNIAFKFSNHLVNNRGLELIGLGFNQSENDLVGECEYIGLSFGTYSAEGETGNKVKTRFNRLAEFLSLLALTVIQTEFNKLHKILSFRFLSSGNYFREE